MGGREEGEVRGWQRSFGTGRVSPITGNVPTPFAPQARARVVILSPLSLPGSSHLGA
jgi:hypothetical protein